MKRFEQWSAKTDTEKIFSERCREAISKAEPSAELILYGSRARGDAHEYSDYDLVVLIDGEVSLEKEDFICHQLYPVELETGEVITAFVYSRSQWIHPCTVKCLSIKVLKRMVSSYDSGEGGYNTLSPCAST